MKKVGLSSSNEKQWLLATNDGKIESENVISAFGFHKKAVLTFRHRAAEKFTKKLAFELALNTNFRMKYPKTIYIVISFHFCQRSFMQQLID